MLATISGAIPDMQMASCWISVPRDGKYAFVSNTGSGTLSSFAIDANGDVALMSSTAATPGGAPVDSTLSDDGLFLYVEDSAQGKLLMYGVNGGSLVPIGTLTVGKGIQGIAGK